jgi:hypothetical protein
MAGGPCQSTRVILVRMGFQVCKLGGRESMGIEVTERCLPEFVLDDTRKHHLVDDEWEGDRSDDATPYRRRRSAGIWVALATLAVALAALAGYRLWKKELRTGEKVSRPSHPAWG